MSKLLLVDDDPNTLASLARAFRLAGHEATVCDYADRALELARSQRFDLILSDVVMPGKDGIQLLEELRAAGIQTPVVMISGQATVEMAVKSTRLGAVDFLEKPLSTEKLLLTVDNVVKLSRLETENKQLKRKVGRHEMVWKSPVMQAVMARVERVAASETRVCILGETGTGKELVARDVELRGGSGGIDRVGTVRAREGFVYWSRIQTFGKVRTGERRDAVSGRDRGHASGDAGKALASIGAEGNRAHRRRPDD
jgi:two-component system, NtrC family, nitrogen regulation response regulator NtrX